MKCSSPERSYRLILTCLFLVVGAVLSVPQIVIADAWFPVASLSKGRNSHTATRLLDGRVLIAGGTDNGSGILEGSSELYDPATDTWSAGGTLQTRRWGHTATLLADGRVLVVGGQFATSSLTGEVYDPATNSWTITPSMSVARTEHTATLLGDGRVLVAGGYATSPSFPLASAEIYDPTTDTWSLATPMTSGHHSHTATRLTDGRVLIVAGGISNCCVSQVEIYNPAANSWTSAAPTTGFSGMAHHSATLLADGRVLTVGGGQFLGGLIYNPATNTWSSTSPMPLDGYLENHAILLADGRVMVVGGDAPAGVAYAQAAVEIYNPATDSWSVAPSMSIGRSQFSATLLFDGRVLVAAGNSSGGSSIALTAAEIYDANATNNWSSVAVMSRQRAEHTATLLNDSRLLVAGGRLVYKPPPLGDPNSATGEVEIFNPSTNNWSAAGSLATPRIKHTATLLLNGRVLVTGGWDTATTFDTAEIFNSATNTWSSAGTMATARREHTAVRLSDGRVLIVGGTNTGITSPSQLASAEIYDPATNGWTTVAPMNGARRLHTALLLFDGRVLVAGGGGGHFFAEVYDAANNSWVTTGNMSFDRTSHTAVLLNDGRVLVAGGGPFSGTESAEIFNPASNSWASAGLMSFPRREHTATRLLDGTVLVTGGSNNLPFLASANVYDPATNSWFYEDTMRVDRALHTATLLSDGRVLVIGGTHDKGSVFNDGISLSSAEIFTNLQDQTITFAPLTDKTVGDSPFTVSAIASSGLPITFSSAGSCSVSSNTVTLLQAGTCTITASQSGNLFWNPAPDVSRTFNIFKATPVIAWNNPADIVYGTALSATQLNATANVVGTFTYTPSVGTVLNGGNSQTLHVDFLPTDTVNYTNASKNVLINVLKSTPTISINNIPSIAMLGRGFAPTYNYTGDGNTSVISNTTNRCTVSSGVVNFITVGTCTLVASATATANVTAATGTPQSFNIGQGTTTISINNIPNNAVYGGSFTPTYAYTGNGKTSATSSTPGVCTVLNKGVVNFVGVGTCTLTAQATGTNNFPAATGSPQSFAVGQATTTISIRNVPNNARTGGSFTPTYNYSGDGPTSTTSNTPSTCTVTGDVVNYVSVGTCTLTAHATAGANYKAADGNPQSFTVK